MIHAHVVERLDSTNKQNAPTRVHIYTHTRAYINVYAYIYTDREIMLFIGNPKGRSRMISNATNPFKESRKESLLRCEGCTSICMCLVCDLVVMCTDIHIYIYIHIHMHLYTHTCTHIYIRMHMHTYAQIENLSNNASTCQAIS